MPNVLVPLRKIAHARSGDKGSHSNIGLIPYTSKGYLYLRDYPLEEKIMAFFAPLHPKKVIRYDLPNLEAFNFVLLGILAEGGSRSLRIDSQGKALGQALLEMKIEIPDNLEKELCKI